MAASRAGRIRFAVGLTVGLVLGVAGLFSVYYVPRKGINPFRAGLTFHVHFARAHGLHPGDPVLLNGLEVGEVASVTLEELPELGVRCVVTAELFDKNRHGPLLRYDSIYTVAQEGLLGRRSLSIVAGGKRPPLDEGAVVPGIEPRDLGKTLDDIQAAVAELRSLLLGDRPGSPSIRRTLRDLEQTVRNIRDFSEKLPR